MTMSVIKNDESVVQEKRAFFDASDQCLANGMTSMPHRLMIGDRPYTEINRAAINGWNTYREFVEKIVRE